MIFRRAVGSLWYGIRNATPSTSARTASASLATEAPVSRLTLILPPAARIARMRSARAGAKALGVPALAKPLIATVSPSPICATAVAASVTRLRKWSCRILEGS